MKENIDSLRTKNLNKMTINIYGDNNMKISKDIIKKLNKVRKIALEQQDLCLEITKYFEKKGFDIDKLADGSGIGLDSVEYGECTVDEFLEFIKNEFDSEMK